jgi:DnaJ-class molecular chaperone
MFGGGGGGGGYFPGGGGGGGPRFRERAKRGKDTVVGYEVGLDDLYKGKTVGMMLERKGICGVCEGSGGKKGAKLRKCVKCEGKVSFLTLVMVNRGERLCPVRLSVAYADAVGLLSCRDR